MEKLTKKQEGFVKDYLETGNGTQAALNNYDTKSENVAAMIASENIRKPKIVNALQEALPDELLAEKHLALLNKQEIVTKNNVTTGEIDIIPTGEIDVQAVKAGLEMAYKLKGSYAPDKIQQTNLNIDITPQALELAKKYDKELNELEDGK